MVAAFGTPNSASVFGTASAPFSLAAFGGMRPGSSPGVGKTAIDEDEDDDDDDDGSKSQRVELREDSISLDQAKRIAMQSASRSRERESAMKC